MRLFACLLLASIAALAPAESQRPNVLLIITDDQGYGDLSCHGNPILQTPHLDALHAVSTRFTDFHVSPTCSPSRGALMSGHYANRSGAWHTIMARSLLFEGEKTLGQVFEEGGYATGMFGKWHLGDNFPFRPEDRGFQTVVRHGGGGVGQTGDHWDNAYFDDTYTHDDGTKKKYDGYCTDIFFAEAKEFIRHSQEAGKPFFAYVSTNAPHGPLHCPEEYIAPYRDRVEKESEAVFFGMIANLDENVGKLRAWLADSGLAENTIVVFMTDNGTAFGESVHNAGMRGKKGSEYDGGHRVPLFIHWPAGGINQPRDIDRLTAHIDLLPTLQALAGLTPDPDYHLDGRSLTPLLENPTAEWPKRVIVTDSQRLRTPVKWRMSSTMTDRWRLVNGKELYDIRTDPTQETDVAASHPEVVERLRNAYDAWWDDLAPSREKQARIVLGDPTENPTRLNCHDWLTDRPAVPWHQGHIRSGAEGHGAWAVRVAKAGRYRITLRRWPAEAGICLTAALLPGNPVPGQRAYRQTLGESLAIESASLTIGEYQAERAIDPQSDSVTFETNLPEGEASLDASFTLAGGKQIGAYYADVKLLE